MKCLFRLMFLFSVSIQAQIDYTSSWKDLLSYTEIVDVIKNENTISAITQNAIFIKENNSYSKFSSVNGLSGEDTSAFYYDEQTQTFTIAYKSGLMDVIDSKKNVKRVVDIVLSDVSINKNINGITGSEGLLYLATEFGIVLYDLENLEFSDTYFIGENSGLVDVNDILIFENKIYATSVDGVYIANVFDNLNDSKNWVKHFAGEFSKITTLHNKIYISQGTDISELVNGSSLLVVTSLDSDVVDISVFEDKLSAISNNQAYLFDKDFMLLGSTESSDHVLTSVSIDDENFFLGTTEKGVLQSLFTSPNVFEEIHPEGPSSNTLFSITVESNDLWMVYGGYDLYWTPIQNAKGVSHYDGESWIEVEYGDPDGVDLAKDLIDVTVDPNNTDKVYISSWGQKIGEFDSTDGGGILVLENNRFSDFWNSSNSGLSNLAFGTFTTTRVSGSVFDSKGDFWVINSLVLDETGALKKKNTEGLWTDYSIGNNGEQFTDLKLDSFDNLWIGSRETGLYYYDQSQDLFANFNSTAMGIPNNNVRAIAVGVDNNIWIGTATGLVLFSDVDNVFVAGELNSNLEYPEAVIIEEEDGASKLLDGFQINDIKVDAVGNVWFATASGGVLQTDSSGKIVLQGFNKDNSPLPSNNVLSIGIDNDSGEVYFGTEKGLVSYKVGVVSYGDALGEVYAYPNPALKSHSEITIIGKDSNLPEGTNMKILDVAGNLVFEANATESQSGLGGKFIWDKRNLAGRRVASGVYIVLMYNSDGQQTSSTKIAIIN